MTVAASATGRAVKGPVCECGVAPCNSLEIERRLAALTDWWPSYDAHRIRRDWQFKTFKAGVTFINKVAALAEAEGHHPDIHLEGYRHVWIELWTHSVGCLTARDFELAAKISEIARQRAE